MGIWTSWPEFTHTRLSPMRRRWETTLNPRRGRSLTRVSAISPLCRSLVLYSEYRKCGMLKSVRRGGY